MFILYQPVIRPTDEPHALNFSEIDENHPGRADRQIDPDETPPPTPAAPEIAHFSPGR